MRIASCRTMSYKTQELTQWMKIKCAPLHHSLLRGNWSAKAERVIQSSALQSLGTPLGACLCNLVTPK